MMPNLSPRQDPFILSVSKDERGALGWLICIAN